MHIERFFAPGLAHVSYVVASRGEAAVVDPERNVDGYLAYLAKNGLKLRYIFLTHPHADFVAGHAELSAGSGAPILLSEKASALFAHRELKDGDRITVGTMEIEVIATPGHSPDSICLCLFEIGVPVALFSGRSVKITTDLFSAYLDCPKKCWLRSRHEPSGINSYAEWVQSYMQIYRCEGLNCSCLAPQWKSPGRLDRRSRSNRPQTRF